MYWEPKKTNRADLEKARPLIFSISLLITMLLVVFAFERKTYVEIEMKKELQNTASTEQIIEIPPTDIPPPPPPRIQMPRIVEVPDVEDIKEEIKVEFDMEVTSQTVTQEITIMEPVKIEEEEADKIFLVVEQSAAPRDGMSSFYKYVSENIKYPAQARRMGVEGKVFVEFVVDKDGSLTQFLVVKGIGAGCDEEAVRIIRNSPPWSPGKQRGKPVKQRLVLPIFFKLASNS